MKQVYIYFNFWLFLLKKLLQFNLKAEMKYVKFKRDKMGLTGRTFKNISR